MPFHMRHEENGRGSASTLGTLFPIVLFVAIGARHSPANMGYFFVGLIEGDQG